MCDTMRNEKTTNSAPSSHWTSPKPVIFLMLCCFGLASFMWIINMPQSSVGFKHDASDTSRPITKNRTKGDFKGDNNMTSPVLKECFDSPFVICANFSQLLKEANDGKNITPLPSNIIHPVSVTNQTKDHPVLGITALIERGDDYNSLRTFDYKVCSLPCQFEPRDRIKEVKGVFIDGTYVRDHDFPKSRYDGQIYIVGMLESPLHVYGNLLSGSSKFKDQINLATTYRVDSNVTQFYRGFCLNDGTRKTREELKQIYDQKTRTAAWFVSNCHTQSKRMEYVRELQKYIDVDIYGKCGKKSYGQFGSEHDLLNKTYKFYLSFENSICKDYVTEKFFKLFAPNLYIIPVVRGGFDYGKYFPPYTFINAADFGSPSDLATFLKDVSGSFENYVKYLEARNMYLGIPWVYKHRKWICSICAALHQSGNAEMSRFKDFGQYFAKGICHSPDMSWRK